MEELSKRIARQSTNISEELPTPVTVSQQKYKSEFPVIITIDDADKDIDEIKRNVKEVCKLNSDVPFPRDVVITKGQQVTKNEK